MRTSRRGRLDHAAAFVRKWRGLFRETSAILSPADMRILIVSHFLIVFAEDVLRWVGLRVFGKFPRTIESRGRPVATVVLAPGLQQTPFSAYPFGWFLATVFRFRVLLASTPPQGNFDSFEDTVDLNRWIIDEIGTGPIVGIGFSKGGQDLAWIFSTMMHNDPTLRSRIALVMMSTPLRGTRMAKVVHTKGAAALLPDSQEIQKTLRLVAGFAELGIPVKFFCAIWDRIVRRSDSRPPNVEGYRPPTLLERLRGIRRRIPWYWSQTLWLQFGHGAIYSPLAWYQVGRYVTRDLLPRL